MQQVSNNIRKTVRSLAEAKHRRAAGLFVAEGTKCVLDTIGTFSTAMLLATPQWFAEHGLEVNEESRVLLPDGGTKLVYFKREFAGFAVHLCRE